MHLFVIGELKHNDDASVLQSRRSTHRSRRSARWLRCFSVAIVKLKHRRWSSTRWWCLVRNASSFSSWCFNVAIVELKRRRWSSTRRWCSVLDASSFSLRCFRRPFTFHPIGNPSPPTQLATLRLPQTCNGYFFFSFWVNFCLMILVPLGIFV